jgi:hypothetical protein
MRRVRQRRQRLKETLSSQLRRCAPLAIPVCWYLALCRAPTAEHAHEGVVL